MDRYTTVMIIPEKAKKVRSFRIPRIFFRSLAFLFVVFHIFIGILAYDYWQILQQVYENRHLSIENRQLKEQIQLFQMKINSLTEDISRIHTFEKKLRIITGIEDFPAPPQNNLEPDHPKPEASVKSVKAPPVLHVPERSRMPSGLNLKLGFENMESNPDYKQLKALYDKKIASDFGMQSGYKYTKEWSQLNKRSFALAQVYATFDFKYNKLKHLARKLELDIHELDQKLLDLDSFLKSTPTILPTAGWITSYFGPRKSPYAGRIKMHEGLDVGGPIGTPIIAPADGIVTYSGIKPGFGKYLQIDHGYGVETIYGHNNDLYVRNGQKVKRGDKVASVGNTGLSTGPHLHYEVRINGIPVDPFYFILN